MSLSTVQIRGLKPQEKPFKKYDSNGLYIEVRPTGSKLWRFKYKFAGKHKLLALDEFPTVSLKDARNARDKAKHLLLESIDPAHERQVEKDKQVQDQKKLENTLNIIATEWWQNNQHEWTQKYKTVVWRRLELNMFPWLGLPFTHKYFRTIITHYPAVRNLRTYVEVCYSHSR